MLITKIPSWSFIEYRTLDAKPVKKFTPCLIGKIVNKREGLRAALFTLIARQQFEFGASLVVPSSDGGCAIFARK